MTRPLAAPSVETDDRPGDRRGWVLEPVDNREMVTPGLDDETRRYVEPGPDIGHQLGLADEFGALVTSGPGGERRTAAWQMQGCALERRLLHRHTECHVHLGLQQRPQIMQPADRQRRDDPVEDGRFQPAILAEHAGDEMATGGMAGKPDRASDLRSR